MLCPAHHGNHTSCPATSQICVAGISCKRTSQLSEHLSLDLAMRSQNILLTTPSCRTMNAQIRSTRPQAVTTPVSWGPYRTCAPSLLARSARQNVPRRRFIAPRADLKRNVEGVARAGDRMADSVADILPGSVPRAAAKVGLIGIGSLIAFSLLQKIFSTFLFLGLIAGAAYLWVKLSSGSDGGGGSGSDDDDPLSSARRIMDKYK